MTQSRVETLMRAVAMLIALVVTSYLAIAGNTEAAGAVFATLGASASYIFRGKVEKSS